VLTVVVPVRVAPARPEAIVAVIGTFACATLLPEPSLSCSAGCGPKAIPLWAVLEGAVVKASWFADPAIVDGELMAEMRPGEVTWRVYEVPCRLSEVAEGRDTIDGVTVAVR
jgi:hypothetical protein